MKFYWIQTNFYSLFRNSCEGQDNRECHYHPLPLAGEGRREGGIH